MPQMAYTARTLAGDTIEGRIRARTPQDARDALSGRGMDVIELSESASAGARAGAPRFAGRHVNTRTLAAVTGQLALMLKTGTSLVESLEALGEQADDERLASILNAVKNEVTGGSTLATSLAAHPRVFDGFYVSAIRAGEASGRLGPVFEQLEEHLQKRLELRHSIVTALIYPAIISTLAVAAVAFVVTFVLPKFVRIFEQSGVALPLPTRMLMGISQFVISYWYVLLLAAVALPTAAYFFVTSPRGGHLVDRFTLKMPIIGPMAIMIQSTLLLRTLGTLLDAGVPLLESLGVAADACKNSRFKAFVVNVTEGVMSGRDLSSNFAKSDLMSPSIKQMVATGERTGSLAFVMNSIADHLGDAAYKQLKRLSTMFEPIILIAMGVVIGFIAVSVLLPLFKLTSAARGG